MMRAGKYYVGDLCYVLNDEDWDNVCALIIKDNQRLEGEFELRDGRRFAIYGTTWGDGAYEDEFGKNYSVDSGTIGCILLEDITKGEILESFGNIVEFHNDFETFEKDGIIHIGKIVIDTDPIYDEEEEEEW